MSIVYVRRTVMMTSSNHKVLETRYMFDSKDLFTVRLK